MRSPVSSSGPGPGSHLTLTAKAACVVVVTPATPQGALAAEAPTFSLSELGWGLPSCPATPQSLGSTSPALEVPAALGQPSASPHPDPSRLESR